MLQEIQNIILEEIHGIKNESEPGTNNELDHIVEIIVHINENLGERQRADLIIALEGDDGITAAEFCPLRCHLMLVSQRAWPEPFATCACATWSLPRSIVTT